MQKYGELKHIIDSFNQLIFGRGFYYYWVYDQSKAMKSHVSTKKNGHTLVIESTFDACYDPSFRIYIKNCFQHDLIEDYYIPDHWSKVPFELESVVFATVEEDTDNNLVQEFLLKLHFRPYNETTDYFLIKGKRFYFEKLHE